METKTMKRFLVVGASRGVGAAVVERLLAEGHEVTALSRSPLAKRPRLNPLAGDATSSSDVTLAVAGQDAVIVTLGITESPVRVRLLGPRATRIDVRSVGTQHVVDAMRARGVRRLVVLTSYGVGATRDRLGVGDRLLFALLLRPQIEDTAAQERIVTASGLDWTLAQPVHLTDADDDALPFASRDGDTHHMDVSRRSVARFLAEAATSPSHLVGASVALSRARVAAAA